MTPATAKKLFLVDAMGFVFRAFFAPMARLSNPQGVPTKVPYLFSSMLRKLIKESRPEYIAVVFDTPGPTFRDKLFEEYKAHRPKMPDDLPSQIIIAVHKFARLPVGRGHGDPQHLEYAGYGAFAGSDASCQADS